MPMSTPWSSALTPLSPAMRTLADASSAHYSLADSSSIASLLPKLVAALGKITVKNNTR